jgi:hypothetical protein
VSTTCLSPAFDVKPVGAGGGGGGGAPAGVALASFDIALMFPPFMAASLKKYLVPFVSPVSVKVVPVIPVRTGVDDSPFAAVPRKRA